ncbi:Protein aurora borealis [Holothuria leucospilota]|uniref:Protein aurora borealis n=1 Tax=Holothuria leucospilota TaxID=206669 RepID=A0A9Q1CSU6_HOLLE|nr:Protein aurora borealis [Holothuria leucospilota]
MFVKMANFLSSQLVTMEDETTSSSNLTFNPFEAESLDSLHLPTFSPSVFSTKVRTPSSSKKKPGEFRWSIDQLASLYPADIDESQPQEEPQLDQETEEKVQHTISQFFAQKLHVPSPWSEPRQVKIKYSKSPLSISSSQPHLDDASPVLPKERVVDSPPVPSCGVDAICQTVISLPVNFDLMALLGDQFKPYSETEEDSNPLSFSHRRKLFPFSDSSHSLTPNSSNSLKRSDSPSSARALPSPDISPVQNVEDGKMVCEPKTPGSAGSQLSSSPLVLKMAPGVCTPYTPKRPPPHMANLGTPLLSPICKDSETPRTGKPDKRAQSVSFASKLFFSTDLPSSSPKNGKRQEELDFTRGETPDPVPGLEDTESSMDIPPTPADHPCNHQSTKDEKFDSEVEQEKGRYSRSEPFTSLYGDGDRNFDHDKLTSTQLEEGNSGNDLTFDLTMNEANLTAMETSSMHIMANFPLSSSNFLSSHQKLLQEESLPHPKMKPPVSEGDVAALSTIPNSQGPTDSGYGTHSLPSTGVSVAVTSSSQLQETGHLPVRTLSSSGSLPSLSF